MADSDDAPVYKITIQRESPVKGGEPKFSLVPENFSLPGQGAPQIPVPLASDSVCPTVNTSPVFSSYMKCAVPNCNNYFDGQRCEFMGISYFAFPQDPELRQEWINAIDLPRDKDPDQLKVCSDHFMNKDFVSDFIEVEGDSEETEIPKSSKSQETVELKPGVKPTVKLGEAQKTKKMADYAKSTWEKNVKTYTQKSRKGGGKGKFAGLDNPLMDTANELRSSISSPVTSTSEMELASVDEPSAIDAMGPVITSVGTIHAINTIKNPDHSSDETLIGKSQKELDRERATEHGTLVDVVEVEDDDDDILEEMVAQKLAWRNQKKQDKMQNPKTEADQGLINVPASVKLPPRKTITGDSSTTGDGSTHAGSQPPDPVPSSSRDDTTFPSTSDIVPSTSSWQPDPPVSQRRTRRRRRTRAEMQKREEEDEWEPTFWSKKTLVKEGYEFEPKRRAQTQKVPTRASKGIDMSNDEDGLEEFDEGFRIDEPVATRSQDSSPEKRRRPGPASKTSRPQYIPPTSDQSDAELNSRADPTSENTPENGAVQKDLEEVMADKSLLVEWAFFKSLIPDLGKMSRQKRDELKTFMLDTLNARIYEGKPIMPNCSDPLKI